MARQRLHRERGDDSLVDALMPTYCRQDAQAAGVAGASKTRAEAAGHSGHPAARSTSRLAVAWLTR